MSGFKSTKTFGHEFGLSCAFRQWRATHSHCQYIHGYAISVKMTFGCTGLDDKNWVMDFGAFKEFKELLQDTFDHKMIVAVDDPKLDEMMLLDKLGIAQVVVLRHVGCERFAEYIALRWEQAFNPDPSRIKLESVEVAEHGGNSSIYYA